MTTPAFAYPLDAFHPDGCDPDTLQEGVEHLETFLACCRARLRAMRLRADGKITYARQLEDQADALYHCLPANWQW